MDEEEFQRLVTPLRQRHVACAEAAIGAPVGLTQIYADLAREAEGAIDKVTQQYEFDKAQAAIEQRLSSDITPVESAPIPDAVWTGALTFHCPICNAMGSVAGVPRTMNDPIVYSAPSGHEDLGGGEFACPQPDTEHPWRPWRVSRFQDRPGDAVVQTFDSLDTMSWVERHDQLVKEWFDGEKALIADLYPSAPRPTRKPQHPSRELVDLRRKVLPNNIYIYITLASIACVGLQLLGGHIFVAIIWITAAAVNYMLALRKAKQP